MSKQNLLVNTVEALQGLDSQQEKQQLLQKYKNEKMLERIISIAYNPWINLKLQNFESNKSGKMFGMGISKFLHIIDDIIDNKLDEKEKRFSCNMALTHINNLEADLFKSLITQSLDLGLEIDTINAVWPGLIMKYPIRFATYGDVTDYENFPACVQPVSTGLRVNVIVNKDTVSYRDKDGNIIEGWDCWNEQFVNLAQGQETVLDGHAVVVDTKNNVVSRENNAVLESPAENIRFIFWDAVRYDGFIRGKDTRIGYNWRYNGLQHMMMLAIEQNPTPCYAATDAEMVGSQEQLDSTIEKMKYNCVVKQMDGIWQHGETNQEIILI